MRIRIRGPGKPLLFCLLSLADLALTCWLLGNAQGQAYEANPLARWCLSRHGLPGLACFKLASVLAVLGLAWAISRSRPRAGGGVLTFACAALAAVVLYSAALCLGANASPERLLAEKARRLDRELRKAAAYRALMERLAEGVAEGRLTLREAAALAGESEKGQDPAWLECLGKVYPGRAPQECLAANVFAQTLASRRRGDAQAARDLAARLRQEFYLSYGSPAPLPPPGIAL